MRAGYRVQSSAVDRQRGEIITSAYLIEIKDNIHEFCTRPRPENSGSAPQRRKRADLDLGQVRSGMAA